MSENTTWAAIAFFICAFLSFAVFATWQNSIVGKANDTQRMVACVEAGKDWAYVDDRNTFQCIGGR